MDALHTLVQGNNAFSLDLYHQLSKRDGNLFFSPYSISVALAMVFGGAQGATEKQMAQTLRFFLNQGKLHPAFRSIQIAIAGTKGEKIILRDAKSIWPHVAYSFKHDYLKLLEEYYSTTITAVDYQTALKDARQKINAWVEEKTEHKIRELVGRNDLSALTRMVLVDAIYFKGNWLTMFDESQTVEEPFWVTTNENINVPMMKQKGDFRIAKNKNVQILELPYDGERVSMLILLPTKHDGLEELESIFDMEMLTNWMSQLYECSDVQISIPRFKLDCKFSLGDTLQSMGITDAFEENVADFSGMDRTRMLFISNIIHQAFVDVNEDGTEAAAATATVMRGFSIPSVFCADHPFLFLIHENSTGSILFMGRVICP